MHMCTTCIGGVLSFGTITCIWTQWYECLIGVTLSPTSLGWGPEDVTFTMPVFADRRHKYVQWTGFCFSNSHQKKTIQQEVEG